MSTRERRERERERRRRDILDAARRVFWQNGYARTTMPQIARAAELAPGTLYLYFASKSSLYAELLIEGYDRLLPRLVERVEWKLSPQKQAESLIDAFFEFAADSPEYFNIIFFLLQQEGRGSLQQELEPEQLERLDAKAAACKALARGILQGTGLSQRNLARRVDAIWSMLAGVVFFFRGDGPAAFKAVAAEAKKILLAAFFNPAP